MHPRLGLLLILALGIFAIATSFYLPFLNSILLGLFLGLLIGNIFEIKSKFDDGIKYASKNFLELSIVFLAFGVNITHLNALGWQSLLIVVINVFALILLTIFLAKYFNCPSSIGWLVGFGTTICGSSAIAALAPSIKQNKEDIGISMAVINLYGTLGMIILPFVLNEFAIDDKMTSILIGGSLHAVGHVVGGAFGLSDTIGEQALTIKMARVALLGPAIIFFNLMTNHKQKSSILQKLSLPWYVWSFIAISILVSFVDMPKSILSWTSEIGKILLTLAMIAIGIKVRLKDLLNSGQRGLIFGAVIFFIQLILLTLLTLIFY